MIECRFAGFERSFPSSAIELLLSDSVAQEYDLSSYLVIAPTAEAIRILRVGLALAAEGEGRGVLSPTLATPGQVLSMLAPESSCASNVTAIATWAQVLQSADPQELNPLLSCPDGLDEKQSLDLAATLLQLRREISEGGQDFHSASGLIPHLDQERWQLLARLETRYRKLLKEHGWADKEDHIASFLQDSVKEFPYERIFLLGVPDFPQRFAQFLDKISSEIPVTILIAAKEKDGSLFDSFGRPRSDSFADFDVGIADQQIHPCIDMGEAINKATSWVAEHSAPPWPCAFGVGSPATASLIQASLRTKNIDCFDPAGSTFGETVLGQCLLLLHRITQNGETGDLIALLENPVFLRWMAKEHPGYSPSRWIDELQQAQWNHITNELDSLFSILSHSAKTSTPIRTIQNLYQKLLSAKTFFEVLELPEVQSILTQGEDQGKELTEFLDVLFTERDNLEELSGKNPSPTMITFLMEQATRLPVYDAVQSPDEIALYGWLELLWQDSPWLLLVDMTEGVIPSTPEPSPFLNETLRTRLGLSTAEQRTARDAYFLYALQEFREKKGRLDVFTSRKDIEGRDSLPSRLLYFVPDNDLPARIERLSETEAVHRQDEGNTASFALRLPLSGAGWLSRIQSIPVTYFGSWLRCPFTFYLEKVARLRHQPPDKMEMDAADYGTALHEVLKVVDEAEEIRECTDAERIMKFADDFLEEWIRKKYGTAINVFLSLQKASLSQRLHKVCKIKAQDRQEGWQPILVEWDLPQEEGLLVAGLPLSGRIDLVEKNEQKSTIRITDYKTGQNTQNPLDAHWKKSRQGVKFRVDSLFPVSIDEKYNWTNLQLPLYALAIGQQYPDSQLLIDYLVVPQTLSEIKRHSWHNFAPAIAEDALQAAERIAGYWRENAFWPPANSFSYTAYAEMAGPQGLDAWRKDHFLDLSQ